MCRRYHIQGTFFQVWLIFEMFMTACLCSSSHLCPRSLLTWKQFFFFQSEYGLYPQFLTWLITWWLMKNMKKSKRRIQKARFNFSSRFFVRIFISELKFAAFSNLCLPPQKLTLPLFLTAHVTTPFLLQQILPEAFEGVWQILQRNSESVCLAFSCGKRESRTSVFKPSQVHTRYGY